jgi:hypothetical protein
VKSGGLPRGSISLPERIRHDRTPYYEALSETDQEWDNGDLRFPKMDEQVMDMPLEQYSGESQTPPFDPPLSSN